MLNNLIAAENDAMNDYFEAGKNTNQEILRRLYAEYDKYMTGYLRPSWFDELTEIFNYVASKIFECNNNRSRFNEFKFSVQEYTQIPNYGCTCEEYMDFMKERAHLIFEGIAHPIDNVQEHYTSSSNKFVDHLHWKTEQYIQDNFDIIQEAKLTTTKRDKLKDSEFGIPEKRTFPLNDKNHVEAAVKMFPHADSSDRKTLAKRILSKAKEFNMDTSGWDSINKYGIDK